MALIPEPMHDNWIGRHRALRASRRGLFAAAMAGGLAATLAERLPRWLGFSSSTTPDAGDGTLHMLGATSQIPVGGGKIFRAQKVVVTQPAAGTFKAFNGWGLFPGRRGWPYRSSRPCRGMAHSRHLTFRSHLATHDDSFLRRARGASRSTGTSPTTAWLRR